MRALRAVGHDVVAVVAAGAEDDAVIEMAMRGGRIFLTEDRDFGHAAAKPTQGVVPHRTREPISRPWCRTLWWSMEKSSPHASLSSSRDELGSDSLREIDRMDHLAAPRRRGVYVAATRPLFKHPMPSTARADAHHRQTDSRIP